MPKLTPLQRTVLRFATQHRLFSTGDMVVVAVSGGPDSVCLLHVLHSLRERLGIKLHVAHLDHTIRGAEAEDDAAYVAGLASRLGLPVTVQRRDVPAFRKQHSLTLEEAAREVRYAFLAEVARAVGAASVATGHTADDQAETVLMHILRGTGLEGLSGMAPLEDWHSRLTQARLKLARPILGLRRQDTEAYCREQGLEARWDVSNEHLGPLRNRIRHEMLPLLARYNPRPDLALARLSRSAAEARDFLQDEAARLWPEMARQETDSVELRKHELRALPAALRKQILRMATLRLLGDLVDIEASHLEAMDEALGKPTGKRIVLPRGLTFSVGYESCRLALSPESKPPLEGEHRLQVPGETLLPGWRVIAEVHETAPQEMPSDPFEALLDLDKAGAEIVVRSRRRGDRFHLLGMAQPKKLQDFLVDARVDRARRDAIPLVCGASGILWVVGLRLAEAVKVTDSTRKVLRLRFLRA